MKYILNDNVALRSWWFYPYAYYFRYYNQAKRLTRAEFELLEHCNGTDEIEPSELLEQLIQRKLCRQAEKQERLSDWQKLKECDNFYFPAMKWMITGKCNLNCLHCFNARDNEKLQSQFSLEEAEKFLDEARDCGIDYIQITGGEPFCHPQFMEILKSIYSHGMFVNVINTNGWFISPEILDEIKKIDDAVRFIVSYDGRGYHDMIRDQVGAEKKALEAITAIIEKGFPVVVNAQINRENSGTMLEAAKMLSDMGVGTMRVCRTSESFRCLENMKDAIMPWQEYYDSALELAREYSETGCSMELRFWEFMTMLPDMKAYSFSMIKHSEESYSDDFPICHDFRKTVSVASDGSLYPCMQIASGYVQENRNLGNVKETSLKSCLQKGDYINEAFSTVGDFMKECSECAECRWRKVCCAGCRALAYTTTGRFDGPDRSKCLFFNGGYIEKAAMMLPGYEEQKL